MAMQCVGVRWITEPYIKHITTHMVPELSLGTVAQWPRCAASLKQTSKSIGGFKQLDTLCTAAQETSYLVNLRHWAQSCSHPDGEQDSNTSAGFVCVSAQVGGIKV